MAQPKGFTHDINGKFIKSWMESDYLVNLVVKGSDGHIIGSTYGASKKYIFQVHPEKHVNEAFKLYTTYRTFCAICKEAGIEYAFTITGEAYPFVYRNANGDYIPFDVVGTGKNIIQFEAGPIRANKSIAHKIGRLVYPETNEHYSGNFRKKLLA